MNRKIASGAPGRKTLIAPAYFAAGANRELVHPVALYEGPGQSRATIQFDICREKI